MGIERKLEFFSISDKREWIFYDKKLQFNLLMVNAGLLKFTVAG